MARWRSSSGAGDSPCDRAQTLQGSAARMAEPSRAYGTLPSLRLVRVLRMSTSRGDDDVGSGAARMRAPGCTAVQQRQEGGRKERKEPLALSLYASQPWKAEATAHAPRPRRAILITERHLTRTQKEHAQIEMTTTNKQYYRERRVRTSAPCARRSRGPQTQSTPVRPPFGGARAPRRTWGRASRAPAS